MPRTRSVEDILNEIYDRGEIDSEFVTRSEMISMVSTAYADYYAFLANLNPDLFLTSSNISVTSGTDTYDTPDDFWRVMGVDVSYNGDWYILGRFNFASRNELQDSNANPPDLRYRVVNGDLMLVPSPSSAFTARLWYVPAPAVIRTESQTIDGIAGFEEYIRLHVLIQYDAKAEEDATLHASQLNALKQQMRSLASIDDGEPDMIRDCRRESGYFGYYPRHGRP